MLFTTEKITTEEVNNISTYLDEFESENNKIIKNTSVSKYINSLITSCYKKSVEDIANTKVGNKIVRKRNLQQVMQESFFYGANRFGNNFIA